MSISEAGGWSEYPSHGQITLTLTRYDSPQTRRAHRPHHPLRILHHRSSPTIELAFHATQLNRGVRGDQKPTGVRDMPFSPTSPSQASPPFASRPAPRLYPPRSFQCRLGASNITSELPISFFRDYFRTRGDLSFYRGFRYGYLPLVFGGGKGGGAGGRLERSQSKGGILSQNVNPTHVPFMKFRDLVCRNWIKF